jgi:hypothetical protein
MVKRAITSQCCLLLLLWIWERRDCWVLIFVVGLVAEAWFWWRFEWGVQEPFLGPYLQDLIRVAEVIDMLSKFSIVK